MSKTFQEEAEEFRRARHELFLAFAASLGIDRLVLRLDRLVRRFVPTLLCLDCGTSRVGRRGVCDSCGSDRLTRI